MMPMLVRLAVSGLLLAPIHAAAAAAEVSTATCAAGAKAAGANGEAATRTYDMTSIGTIRISCPQPSKLGNEGVAAARDGTQAQVYTGADIKTKTDLSKVLEGATYLKSKEGHNELTVSQLPTAATSLYFLCHQERYAEQPVCWIQVVVAAQGDLGPQGCTVGGSEIALRIKAANETAEFLCATGKSVFPAGEKAYESDCTKVANLTSIVKNAKLTRGGTAAADAMNAFSVSALPSKETQVCYACAGSESDARGNKCLVKITVASSAPGGSMRGGPTARNATAFGVLLVATALWRFI